MSNLNETNSSLVNKTYQVPLNVLQFLQKKQGEGDKRIQGIINSPTLSYEQVKRFKHDIENSYQGDWSPVVMWLNGILGTDRNMVDSQKRTTMEIGLENRFRKTHDKDHNKNLTPLSEVKKLKITEEQALLIRREIVKEANKTICQTPDSKFHISVKGKSVSCKVDLPIELDLSEDEAKILETNIHNAMELVLSKYFVDKN